MKIQKTLEYIRKGVLGLLLLWVLIIIGVGVGKYRSAKNEAPKEAEKMLEERIAQIDKARAEETEIFGGPLTARMSEQEKYEFVRDNTSVIFENTFYPNYTEWMITNTIRLLVIAVIVFLIGMIIASLVFKFKASLLYLIGFAVVGGIFLIAINSDLSGSLDGLMEYYSALTPDELEKKKLTEDNLEFWLGWVNGGVVTVYILAGIALLVWFGDFVRGMIQGGN